MLEVGSIVAGKLRVDRIIGKGGMGVVAVATHLQLDRQVAIKVLHDELVTETEVVERLMREARASSRLKSEHACRVMDVGQLETGAPYIVMELLEGEDLAQLIATAPLDVSTAVDYVMQACVAVAEAHAQGIVHRDLKPANLFVTRRIDGSALIKVLDFGIAKTPTASDFKLTRTQTVMGSPGYMSPEALRSAADVDVRSDVWALGVIMYEAVSGRLPFHATSITELAVKVVIDPPEPLDSDPAYTAVVMRCLEKKPEDRYQSVADLAADLAPLGDAAAQSNATLISRLSGRGPAASARIPKPSDVPPVAKSTLQNVSGQSAARTAKPRGRGVWIAGGLLAAAGAAAGAVLLIRSPEPKPATTPDAAIVIAHAADAAITVDAAPAIDAVDKLRRLAAAHDYYAVLQIADLAKGNPDADAIIADAKHRYVAQVARTIDAEIHDGQCAKAREIASEAQQVVPDDTGLAAKANACTAKPTHVDPVASGMEAAVAQKAYTRGDNAGALAAAEKVLAKQPADSAMLRIAAAAACNLGDAQKARMYAAKLPQPEHDFAVFVCKQNHISLDEPAPQDPYGEADLTAVEDAMKKNDFAGVIKLGDQILKKQKGNLAVLTAVGIAACELKRMPRAKSAWKRLPAANRAPVEQACQRKGIALDQLKDPGAAPPAH